MAKQIIPCSTCPCCRAKEVHPPCQLQICSGCWYEHEGMGCKAVIKEHEESLSRLTGDA